MAIKLEVDREEGGKNNMCPTITYPCVSPYMCGNTAKRRNDYCDECREKNIKHKKITIVCGPPGSGKSTYVNQRKKFGDLIIDLDLIWQALTGMSRNQRPSNILPFVLSCRDNIYSQLREPNDIDTAWIIAGLPRARDREQLSEKLKAKIVLLLFNKETCLNRISNH